MKRIYLIVLVIIISNLNIHAQKRVSFGVSGGLFIGSADATIEGFDIQDISDEFEILDGGGFYLGFLADIKVLGSFHLQPELLYANAGGESVIIAPIMVKYYIMDALNLQIGPQFDILLNPTQEVEELVKTLGLSLGIGAGIDINEKLGIQAKYAFGLNNRSDIPTFSIGEILIDESNLKTNILIVGLIYRL